MEAMKGFASASAAVKPRMVVSTFIACRASPLGFSVNSTMRPDESIFIKPKSLARSSSIGNVPTVMSALLSLCASTNFM